MRLRSLQIALRLVDHGADEGDGPIGLIAGLVGLGGECLGLPVDLGLERPDIDAESDEEADAATGNHESQKRDQFPDHGCLERKSIGRSDGRPAATIVPRGMLRWQGWITSG